MPEIISAKAPGKILWLGGYSILERPNIGFGTTVNAYAHVSVKPNGNHSVEISVPQFAERFRARIDPKEGTLRASTHTELNLMRTAVEVSLKYAIAKGINVHGVSLTSRTDDAMSYKIVNGKVEKSGLGSSAAVTVATIGVLLKAFELDAKNLETLHKLAQMSHSIATGKVGSGYDIAVVTYGSIIYKRYSPDIIRRLPVGYTGNDIVKLVKRRWDYSIERMQMPTMLKPLVASFVGGAAITTELVKKVNEFKARDPGKYFKIIKRLNRENVKAATAIKKINAGKSADKNIREMKVAFERGWEITRELGVSSKAVIADSHLVWLAEQSLKNGALLAKSPGAGGRDSVAALALGDDNLARLRDFWASRKELRILDIDICNTGFEYESAK